MRFEKISFGSIRIDGVTHEYDVVIDGGEVHKRKKKLSKKFRHGLWTGLFPSRRRSPGSATAW
jgi:hypothetical protein